MIRRARPDGEDFDADDKMVWALLREVMHGGPGWNWIKPHSKTGNG